MATTRDTERSTWTLNDVVLIDGTGAPAVPGSRVVIEDGVVVAVQPAARSAGGGSVVQGRGRWLLPGLWDTHMHHGFSAGGMTSADELSGEQLLANWRGYLRSGVTSVVSTGDDPQRMIAARAAERAGELVGPRIFAAGSILTAPGGHPLNTLMHGYASDLGDLAVGVDDPAAATEQVRTALEQQGLDLVKVVFSTIPGDGPRLRRDVLDAIVAEAHRCGRPVIAHVSKEAEAAEAVEAGVDGLEHMVVEGAELLDVTFTTMAERGVLWTPTLSLFDRMAHDRDLSYVWGQRPDGFVSATVLASIEQWAASTAPASPYRVSVGAYGRLRRPGACRRSPAGCWHRCRHDGGLPRTRRAPRARAARPSRTDSQRSVDRGDGGGRRERWGQRRGWEPSRSARKPTCSYCTQTPSPTSATPAPSTWSSNAEFRTTPTTSASDDC